jgi:hypothetical protein
MSKTSPRVRSSWDAPSHCSTTASTSNTAAPPSPPPPPALWCTTPSWEWRSPHRLPLCCSLAACQVCCQSSFIFPLFPFSFLLDRSLPVSFVLHLRPAVRMSRLTATQCLLTNTYTSPNLADGQPEAGLSQSVDISLLGSHFRFLFAESSSDDIEVHILPIAIDQIPHVFNVLRQQIVFSDLYSSCIRGSPPSPTPPSPSPTFIEVAAKSPHFLQITFADSLADDLLTWQIQVLANGDVSSRMTSLCGREDVCGDVCRYAHAILTATHNIPLALHSVFPRQ